MENKFSLLWNCWIIIFFVFPSLFHQYVTITENFISRIRYLISCLLTFASFLMFKWWINSGGWCEWIYWFFFHSLFFSLYFVVGVFAIPWDQCSANRKCNVTNSCSKLENVKFGSKQKKKKRKAIWKGAKKLNLVNKKAIYLKIFLLFTNDYINQFKINLLSMCILTVLESNNIYVFTNNDQKSIFF